MKIIAVKMEKEMKSAEELKQTVKEKYSRISKTVNAGGSGSCCGSGNDTDEIYSVMSDDYSSLEGYNPDADLRLGCGLPTQFAKIKPGDTVVDLGSGAGNDCFVARHEAGHEGRIIGIDFSESMIEKATANAVKLGYENVEFLPGDIEDIPLPDKVSDVVISNCVLNLVPDKQKVFSEIFRILKPGGHFSISDIVRSGELPAGLQKDAEMYAGCVSGSVQKEVYLNLIRKTGFENLKIQKEKPIILPQKLMSRYLNKEEISGFYEGNSGIFSITVYAEKPAEISA
jgi:arsenite methyltransferase